tara:strand:+ start:789 stop:1088 length:300 start_codon:yes stop_codon:yes gene_type:complete
MNLIYHLKLYKSSSKPIIEITTAKKPIYKKLLSVCPRSLVDIKNAIEHAIPPNGGTYLEDSLSSFFLLPGTKFFVLCKVIQLKSMDNKIVTIAALVIDT